MLACNPDLLFHKVEIVEQPLRGRRDPPFPCDGCSDNVISLNQDLLVLVQPSDQAIAATACRKVVTRRKVMRVGLKLPQAEQLRP
jgi:hypothetical protein